jgi:hypothetical protein
MPSIAHPSAHIVAACAAAEHASMHDCIVVMSMPISVFGMDFIMSIITSISVPFV